jgi:glucose/arabinose dehydrogenase
MQRSLLATAFLLAGLIGSCQSPDKRTPATSSQSVTVRLITDGVSHPTAFAATPDNTLLIAEQEGRIRVYKDNQLISNPFLDISKQVVKSSGYDERGLLGLALHPDYAQNGKFYVYYSARTSGANHKSVIQEFKVSNNGLVADAGSGRILLEFDQPESNHNGGDLQFGPDGYLYIASGDGGGGGDRHGEHGNGQNLNTLLGKILRIDVNKTPYGIPADNPFVNQAGVRPEIFAYGLRNPWRFSFDKANGKLFAGDVGQNQYEEVDLVTKGGNYGWRVREGYHSYNNSDPDVPNRIDPITEYSHSEGISITGGFVYRGEKIDWLKGKYVFADWSGPLWYLAESKEKEWPRTSLITKGRPANWQVYSFGQDRDGELYLLGVNTENNRGIVYRIEP